MNFFTAIETIRKNKEILIKDFEEKIQDTT